MKQEDIDNIKAQILRSGFPTEIEVAKYFLEKKWYINYNSYYIDKDEKKGREIDLISDCIFHTKFGDEKYLEMSFSFVVEIKKDDTKPWIFFTTEKNFVEKFENLPRNWIKHNISTDAIDRAFESNEKLHSNIARNAIEGLKPAPKPEQGPAKPGQGVDKLYGALCNVTKALTHAMESSHVLRDKSTDMLFQYYEPLIVYSGELLSASIDKKGKLELKEVDYQQMKFNYLSLGYQESRTKSNIIHIVKKDYLKKFIARRQKQFEKIYNTVLDYEKGMVAKTSSK